MVDIIVRELCNIPHNTSGIVNLTDIDNYNNCSGITGTHHSFASLYIVFAIFSTCCVGLFCLLMV